MTKEITTIYWDIGNVLGPNAENTSPENRPILSLLQISPAESDEVFNKLWPEGIRLGHISEDTYWQAYLAISPNKKLKLEEIKAFYRSLLLPNRDLWKLAQNFAERYDQYILTNHGREWAEFIRIKWDVDKYFKGIFCSAWMGIAKPDIAFFESALKGSNKQPENILYIDDSQKNIEAAGTLGISGIVYISYNQVLSDIAKAGVKI